MFDMNYGYNSAVDEFDSIQGYSATFDSDATLIRFQWQLAL